MFHLLAKILICQISSFMSQCMKKNHFSTKPMHPSGGHVLIRTLEWVKGVDKSACTLRPPCPPAPSLSSCYHHRASVLCSRAPPEHSTIDCTDVIVITCHWYKERHKLEQRRWRQREREWKKWDEWEGFKDCCCCVMVNMLWPYLCIYLLMLELRDPK